MYRPKKKKNNKEPAVQNEPKTPELPPTKPKPTDETTSAARILVGIIGVSLLSVPVCYAGAYLKQMEDSLNVFLYAVVMCLSVAPPDLLPIDQTFVARQAGDVFLRFYHLLVHSSG